MKLSFSTKGWHGYTWDDFCQTAYDLGFSGIEIHNIENPDFTGKSGPFSPSQAQATVRKMYEKNLRISCLDTLKNPADIEQQDAFTEELKKSLKLAQTMHIPYVRIRAKQIESDIESQKQQIKNTLEDIVPFAEDLGVTILIESSGLFAHSEDLLDVLDSFSYDSLAALWDTCSTVFTGNESPEYTIKNLGAYVKHVHMKDSLKAENEVLEHCLIGEGELPVNDIVLALNSINYSGYASIEWDPKWLPELDDMEIIFSHFVSFMDRFGDTSKAKKNYYWNAAHTGNYIWKKGELIDATFSDVLDKMVEEFPNQYAFKYTTLDYTRTYEEFRNDVDECCRAFLALGVRPGSHIAVWATNVPQWYIAFWAATKLGAVLVSMNTAYKISEAEYLLRQSDTHTLILIDGYRDSDYDKTISELCPELEHTIPGRPLHAKRLPFLRNVITVGFKKKGCLTWEEAMLRASDVPVEEVYRLAADVDVNDVCNMQYTSGTTGFPKGVMLTHHNIINDGKVIGDRMDLSTADRMMIQVPMFHCFGMVLAMTATMTHGGTILPLPYFSPKPALACINNERITAFHGVPTMFIAMFNHEDYRKTDFSYMRTGIMAGSGCPADLMRKAADPSEMNMTGIVSVYGQTESAPGSTMSSWDDPLDLRCETVGYAFPYVECKIIDPDTGEELPDGVNGEFCSRGYNTMKGYYKMPEATRHTIDKDGWLHSGDLACRDSQGCYKITGRLKDMIIRGGENIYPKEIEEFFYTHPDVKDVQVIGVPDKGYGEEVMAQIILRDGSATTPDQLRAYALERLARHKVPRYIELTDAFPMNAAGKVLKYKMREDAVKRLGL